VSLRGYRETKPSGALWLGDVPSNWQVRRLKYLCEVLLSNVDKKTYEGELPVKLCNYTDAYYNEEITADLEFMPATATPEQVSRFALRSGDSIVTKDSETSNDIAVASYVPKDLPGVVCGYHLAIVRPKGPIDGRYVKRLFDSKYLKSRFDVAANGLTRVGLSQYAFDNVEIPLPTRDEQELIVAFLEQETHRIDELVAQQERLIELLKEKRQAAISHAVTKGLNPNTPMKPSGIEYLGALPTHWTHSVLTRIARRVVVGIAEAATHAYVQDGIPILRSTNIRPGAIVGEVLRIDEAFALDRGSKLIAVGDLVTVRTGNPGVTVVVPQELGGCHCFTMLVTTLDTGYSPEFFCYWMNSLAAQSYFAIEGWGSAQRNISVPILKALPIPIPPRAEQEEIVAYLDEAAFKFDSLIHAAARAIALLTERRAALVSSAVTGQIDVRKLAPAGVE
jgi:type I restriction enzyme S subunit